MSNKIDMLMFIKSACKSMTQAEALDQFQGIVCIFDSLFTEHPIRYHRTYYMYYITMLMYVFNIGLDWHLTIDYWSMSEAELREITSRHYFTLYYPSACSLY